MLRPILSLPDRAYVLAGNILIFYLVFLAFSKTYLPTGGLESVWLLSGIPLWLFALLSSPWFIPPRDAIANAIVAICILITIDLSGASNFKGQLEALRWLAVAMCILVTAFGVLALFLHDQNPKAASSKLFYRLTDIFGRGELLYTPPALISILGAYQTNFAAVAWLLVLWILIIVGRPLERIIAAYREWELNRVEDAKSPAIGLIERIDHPNIVRVRFLKGATWEPGQLCIACTPDGGQHFVISLFSQLQGTEVKGTALCVSAVQDKIVAPSGYVYATHDQEKSAQFIENLSGAKDAELVGFIVENSTIATLRFEVAARSELAEGDVVFTKIGGEEIFYQILDAETAEESFDQNPRGTHIVRAAQLGKYSPNKGFTKHPWLPEMNTPLFWARSRKFEEAKISEEEFLIGLVPSTNINAVLNSTSLVEYHSAILGVTGTGKTEMVLDLVREVHKRGVKVFCVDFTGEYKARLSDLRPVFPAPSEAATKDLEDKLFAADTGEYGAKAEKRALSESLKTMRQGTAKQIADFLESDDTNLAIFELAEIANSKATLKLTELYLSAIMNWARLNRKARQILIVLEEAHTIIPETFGSGFDYDTQWVVSRIGQIALQGRKYGVGLMIVSQRTALVSKTILSQCNTFFTYSLIDQTSLNFLESVYSNQHTRSIPNLGQFEFLAFGKALRAERPILLKRSFDQSKKDASDALRVKLKKPIEKAPPP